MDQTPIPGYDTPEEWQRISLKIRKIAERLLAAGWATQVRTDRGTLTIDWTPAGTKKIRRLIALYHELGLATLEADHMFALWLVARLTAESGGDA